MTKMEKLTDAKREKGKVGFVDKSVWITLLILLVLPFLISKPLATEILIYGLFALAFNLLLGHTGVLSFGHAAYFGVGAYAGGMALRYFQVSVWTSLVVAMVVTALVAAGIGAMAIKKKGVYFAMISLAFGQMLYFMALSPFKKWTGGEDGLKFIPILKLEFPLHVDLTSALPLYYFTFFVVGLAIIALWRILDSPFGRVLKAIRENEIRTRAIGYNVVRAKFLSLVISGSFSGLAGALFTVYLGYGSLMTLFWMTSGSILMMTLLGGMHTFIGPVVGVGVFMYLQNTISVYTDRWQLFVGALFVVLVLFFPDGLVGTIKMKYRERKSGV